MFTRDTTSKILIIPSEFISAAHCSCTDIPDESITKLTKDTTSSTLKIPSSLICLCSKTAKGKNKLGKTLELAQKYR